ncbi:MAG: abortive infection family protein, partial [Synergistaceae bacterium]|nr:abortive infection family protein [Synergistaceae bacterium]
GTGHGKDGRSKGLSTRHARLAVGAASTFVRFLFETHIERSAKTWEMQG